MTKAIRSLAGLLLIAVLVLFTSTADAQNPTRRPPEQILPTGAEDSAQSTPADEAGARVLEAITSTSIAGLTFEQRGDGTIGLDLQGRFMHVLTAAPGPPRNDGRLEVACYATGDPKLSPSTAVTSWKPVTGGPLKRLDVTGLRAPLPVIAEKTPAPPPVLEEK